MNATHPEIRTMLVEALEYASVYSMRHLNLTEGFLAGTKDVSFEELDMDSLAIMELCIAIELNAGISLVPEELESIGSLDKLISLLAKETS